MRKSFLIGAAALVAIVLSTNAAFAGHAGELGLGVLYRSAPIGIFYGVSDEANLHLGLGFDSFDVEDGGPVLEKTRFAVAGALEYDIWSGESWGFGVFPGLLFESTSFTDPPAGGTARDSMTEFHIAVSLGGHFDMGDHVTMYFKHGLAVEIVDTGFEGADSTTDFISDGWNVGELGINFWVNP
jgi:hypothetical protein